ncbi:hypothetical protein [Pusillimonas sp.]|uniref:DODA-type extradiol aromatic ring-opening family dioxygenase n=1 Tax=Pusillimonas sp. TaxID=3040095 RepID=UPI0037C8A183
MKQNERQAGDLKQIVAAISMTHTPGLGDRLDAPPPEQMGRLYRAFETVRADFEGSNPDLILAFVNDHFDQYWLNNMPTFSVGVSAVHYGPSTDAEAWLQMSRREHPGHEDYARDILLQSIKDGFDMARSGAAEFNHNVLIPKKFIWPNRDIPVVPMFINCFAPPLPSWERCFELGRSIRRVIDQRPESVALVASGGISHWPPFVNEETVPEGDLLLQRQLKIQREGPAARALDQNIRADFHAREAEMASGDRSLINVEWDQRMMNAFAAPDFEYLLSQSYDDVERDGGNGGHEMALWMAVLGALDGAAGKPIIYEAVREWMGGVGLVQYKP